MSVAVKGTASTNQLYNLVGCCMWFNKILLSIHFTIKLTLNTTICSPKSM
uniref:Uncharacterized protein n=1 Tax=Anguilla anguilla TaxID=7936 RepID=A0A0E9W2L0_ANGAN